MGRPKGSKNKPKNGNGNGTVVVQSAASGKQKLLGMLTQLVGRIADLHTEFSDRPMPMVLIDSMLTSKANAEVALRYAESLPEDWQYPRKPRTTSEGSWDIGQNVIVKPQAIEVASVIGTAPLEIVSMAGKFITIRDDASRVFTMERKHFELAQ